MAWCLVKHKDNFTFTLHSSYIYTMSVIFRSVMEEGLPMYRTSNCGMVVNGYVGEDVLKAAAVLAQ
jgi:hypothetical protein